MKELSCSKKLPKKKKSELHFDKRDINWINDEHKWDANEVGIKEWSMKEKFAQKCKRLSKSILVYIFYLSQKNQNSYHDNWF